MTEPTNETVEWKSLPPLDGGVYVGMVTEVLDKEGIANVVKTDLEAGGLGVVMGTTPLGDPWRIQVPAAQYDRALAIYQELIGQGEEGGPDQSEESDDEDEGGPASSAGAQESV